MKKSELHLTVTLDENRVPETIQWHSTGDSTKLPDDQAAHALNLTLWNKDEGGSVRVGLFRVHAPCAGQTHESLEQSRHPQHQLP